MSYMQQYENSTDKFANQTWDNKWGSPDCSNQNYIDWITYDIGQVPEYKNGTFYFEDNNDQCCNHIQENTVTNENILAASAEFYDKNIENENYNDTSFPIDQQTTCAENLQKYLSEIDENNNEETPEDSDIQMDNDIKYEESTIKKNNQKVKDLHKGAFDKYYYGDIIYEKYKEEDNDKEEEKDSIGEKEPSDNMRKKYNYNLSLPLKKTVKNEQIGNERSNFGFPYQ